MYQPLNSSSEQNAWINIICHSFQYLIPTVFHTYVSLFRPFRLCVCYLEPLSLEEYRAIEGSSTTGNLISPTTYRNSILSILKDLHF